MFMRPVRYEVKMFCHNAGCEDFGEAFPIRVTTDSWDAPGEYVDDPECPTCLDSLEDYPPPEEEDDED